ncbi:hypothetical protein CEXT_130701 [Caerostris extrusa]|uniref:Uncharacterized protein n=1 Tax=Caerostris extrusa TaxID=172846 RepID=A0AAV4VHY1_CAEEX|nr:hypothetical protein CEXT_130701 [Caerostris extrusa]
MLARNKQFALLAHCSLQLSWEVKGEIQATKGVLDTQQILIEKQYSWGHLFAKCDSGSYPIIRMQPLNCGPYSPAVF